MAKDERPQPVHTSHSFPRMDDHTGALSPRKRAGTLGEQSITAVPAARNMESSPGLVDKRPVADVFENREGEDEVPPENNDTPEPELQLPSTFDELPIEIRSLTERFLESLSAKVHPSPLTSDALSGLFQDFYDRAANSIATHIASLSSRIGREKSPAPSNSSRGSGKGRVRAGSGAKRTESSPSNSGGEMLTALEVADRRKARRLLELKRLALEEAVERAVCERVYDRIYKHKSTDDDARDEKLRSRTAALSLVGIGLKELHADSLTNQEVRKATEENEQEINHSLAPAREALQCMNDERYPLGKLNHLTEAHKSIVETLSQLFPSSSSADEILPTLIYTLITSSAEHLSVVSNLNFIQRFRGAARIDGEAAYCLVNLEAAVSFLETVDLSSLRAEQLPDGRPKSSSGPVTPTHEQPMGLPTQTSPAQKVRPDVSVINVESTDKSTSPKEAVKALPSPRTPNGPTTHQQRRISALVQAQADRIEAGRENILNTADKIYESINGTLENSLQYVFGRFKDQQTSGDSPLPKTLEDARKLVSSPPLGVGEDEDGLDLSGRSSPASDDPLTAKNDSSKVIDLIGGRRQLRDRSVDSSRSGGSSKRVLFAEQQKEKSTAALLKDDPAAAAGNLFATINTINPLNRFNVPGFGRFGRAGGLPTPPAPSQDKSAQLSNIVKLPDGSQGGALLEKQRSRDSQHAGEDDLNAREALAELRKLKPPRKRFLEVQSAGDLRVAEIEDLLLEYRRLAKAIGEAIAM